MSDYIMLDYLRQHPDIGISHLPDVYVYFKFKAYLQTTLRFTRKTYCIREGNTKLCLFAADDLNRMSDESQEPFPAETPYDLEWAIGQLEPQQAEVIRLYYYDGKTDLEISHMRKVSRQAVNNLKHRALRKLKLILQ